MAWDVLFESKTVVKDTTETSARAYLSDGKNNHAIQYKLTGDGTLDLYVDTSIDGEDWISNGIKADDITDTSGPGSDGKDIIPLSLKPGEFLRVRATEVTTSDDVVLMLWLVQK
jgi:hypothetical protein